MVIPAVKATECHILSVWGKVTAFFDLYLDQLAVIFAKLCLGFAMVYSSSLFLIWVIPLRNFLAHLNWFLMVTYRLLYIYFITMMEE